MQSRHTRRRTISSSQQTHSTDLNGSGHYLELFTDLSVADAKLAALPLEVLVELGGADAGVPEDDAVDKSRVHKGVLLLSQPIACLALVTVH